MAVPEYFKEIGVMALYMHWVSSGHNFWYSLDDIGLFLYDFKHIDKDMKVQNNIIWHSNDIDGNGDKL